MSRSLSEPSERTWISRASLKVSTVWSSATGRTMVSAGRARSMGLRTVTAAPGAAARLEASERTKAPAAQRRLTTGAQDIILPNKAVAMHDSLRRHECRRGTHECVRHEDDEIFSDKYVRMFIILAVTFS